MVGLISEELGQHGTQPCPIQGLSLPQTPMVPHLLKQDHIQAGKFITRASAPLRAYRSLHVVSLVGQIGQHAISGLYRPPDIICPFGD